MKHLKLFEDYWEKAAKKSKLKKQKQKNWLDAMKSKYGPLWDEYLGKVVKYKEHHGIVIVKDNLLLIRWDTRKEDDCERLDGGNWTPEIVKDQDYNFKFINRDGTLKDEFKKEK